MLQLGGQLPQLTPDPHLTVVDWSNVSKLKSLAQGNGN